MAEKYVLVFLLLLITTWFGLNFSSESSENLPLNCDLDRSYKFQMKCHSDIPDFSQFDSKTISQITTLVVEDCHFVIIPQGFLRSLLSLTHLTIDCVQTVVEEGAFDGLTNLTSLTVGKNADILPSLCGIYDLETLNLDHNSIGSESNLGIATNCSQHSRPSYCLNLVTSLSASDNLISSLTKDGFLCGMRTLTELNLTKNQISTIENGVFDRVPHIDRLYLGNNLIEELNEDVFKPLINLSRLDLSNNRLKSLPGRIFSSNEKLFQLNLNGNLLTSLDSSIFENATELNGLDLSNNQISVISEFGTTHKYLSKINLSGNRLEYIGASTFLALRNLKGVNFDNNRIREIDDQAFETNTELSVLSFSHNLLKKVPNMSKLTFLFALFLDDNEIEEISSKDFNLTSHIMLLHLAQNKLKFLGPNVFKTMNLLMKLNLSHNALEVLENAAFTGLFRLTVLSLDGNRLSFQNNVYQDYSGQPQMDVFRSMRYLSILNMSDNELSKFEYSWFPPMLLLLDLSRNKIQQLPKYKTGSLSSLTTLDLSNNQIRQVEDGQFPPSINHLFLSSNNISHIEADAFEDLPGLETLHLSENSLRTLSKLKLTNPSTTNIFLRDNPWICDCKINWLKEAKRGIVSLYDTILMQCETLFNHTGEEGPRSFLETRDEHFLCAYSGTRTVNTKCVSSVCLQQNKCPENCTCYHNLEWTIVKIMCSNSNYTQVPSSAPNSTDVVYLDGNSIGSIDSESFRNYPFLRNLFLRRSKLGRVGPDTFRHSKAIEKIYLDHNQLELLSSQAFRGLKKVTHVDLSFNNLEIIEVGTFFNLTSLQVLNLKSNFLTVLPAFDLTVLPAVKSIELVDNPWICDCGFLRDKSNQRVFNWTHLYCNTGDFSNGSATLPMTVFNFTHCSSNAFGVVVRRDSTNHHVTVVAVSVMFSILFIIIAIIAVVYRYELKIALERTFVGRLLVN